MPNSTNRPTSPTPAAPHPRSQRPTRLLASGSPHPRSHPSATPGGATPQGPERESQIGPLPSSTSRSRTQSRSANGDSHAPAVEADSHPGKNSLPSLHSPLPLSLLALHPLKSNGSSGQVLPSHLPSTLPPRPTSFSTILHSLCHSHQLPHPSKTQIETSTSTSPPPSSPFDVPAPSLQISSMTSSSSTMMMMMMMMMMVLMNSNQA